MRQARYHAFFSILLFVVSGLGLTVAADNKHHPQQGSSGITWAQQAMATLTGGNPVTSVTESGSVVRTVGNDQESGTITLQSSGNTSSQIQISTGQGNRSETRSWATDGSGPLGQWTGLNGQQHQMAQQNCWTDAVWFFPALSLLSDTADPTLTFVDLGQEQYNGDTVEHIQAYRSQSLFPPPVQQASTVDYFLDSQTALPVGMAFSIYSDTSAGSSVPVSLIFSQYQTVDGVQVPFQVSRSLNGSPYLQITLTSAAINGAPLPR
jgi:hypothetical protein